MDELGSSLGNNTSEISQENLDGLSRESCQSRRVNRHESEEDSNE